MTALSFESSASSPLMRRTAVIRTGLALAFTVLIALCIGAPSSAQDGSKDKKKPPEKPPVVEVKNVLVFPTDTRGGTSDAVGDDIVAAIKSRLSLSKLYEPVTFSAAIPTVKLAITDQRLTQSEVRKPFDSDSKLRKIAGITGYNFVIVSSIDDYQYDSAKNQVSVVMSARLIDYSGAKAVPRSAAQSATSPANAGNTPELKLATDLVRGLTDKLMTAILTPKPAK